MGAAVVLSEAELVVEPGHAVSVDVEIRSTTAVVDQFALQVLGPAAAWATMHPAELSLFPGGTGTATVTFAVPRTSLVEAGEVPFAVKVNSLEDGLRPVVEEGSLFVGPFADLGADLVPRTSAGVRGGKHELAFDNYGNTPVTGTLSASDPDVLLHFTFEPAALVVEPGGAEFARLRVRPRKALWRGLPQPRPFQVSVTVAGRDPVTAEGIFLQRPRIPTSVAKIVLLAVVAALVLGLLWVTVLRPSVKSAAQDAVSAPLAEQAAETADLANKQTQAGIGVAGSTLEALADSGAGNAIATAAAGEDAHSLRLAVDGTGTVDKAYAVPDGKMLTVSDIILQNPAGNEGFVELRRDDEVLLRNALVNFRDLDFHFLAPILFAAGQHVVLHVECAGPAACTPAAYLAGRLRETEPPSTATTAKAGKG